MTINRQWHPQKKKALSKRSRGAILRVRILTGLLCSADRCTGAGFSTSGRHTSRTEPKPSTPPSETMLRAGPDRLNVAPLNPTPERVSQSALTGFLAWVPGRCQTEDSMLFRLQARHGYVRNVNRGGWVGGEREFGLRSRGARRTQVQLLWSGVSAVMGRF